MGPWRIKKLLGLTNCTIINVNGEEKCVHVNQLKPIAHRKSLLDPTTQPIIKPMIKLSDIPITPVLMDEEYFPLDNEEDAVNEHPVNRQIPIRQVRPTTIDRAWVNLDDRNIMSTRTRGGVG